MFRHSHFDKNRIEQSSVLYNNKLFEVEYNRYKKLIAEVRALEQVEYILWGNNKRTHINRQYNSYNSI